jgi:hypothetical protein
MQYLYIQQKAKTIGEDLQEKTLHQIYVLSLTAQEEDDLKQ